MTNKDLALDFKIGKRKGVQIHIPVDVVAQMRFQMMPKLKLLMWTPFLTDGKVCRTKIIG
jgi:hypothetical protein